MSNKNKLPTLKKPRLVLEGEQYILHNGKVLKLDVREFGSGSSQLVATVGGRAHVVIPEEPSQKVVEGMKFEDLAFNLISLLQRRVAAEESKNRSLELQVEQLKVSGEAMSKAMQEMKKEMKEMKDTCADCKREADSKSRNNTPNSGSNAVASSSSRSGVIISIPTGPAPAPRPAVETVESWLAKQGVSVGRDGRWKMDAAFAATSAGRVDVLKWLHARDDVHIFSVTKGANTICHEAAKHNKVEVLEWLHEKDLLYLDWPNAAGENVKEVAIECGSLEVLKWLNQRGWVDMAERTSKCGATMAHRAAMNGRFNVLMWLYSNRQFREEEMDAVDDDGWTIAHYAAYRGHVQTLSWLLNKGLIDLRARTKDYKTVYDIADETASAWIENNTDYF